MQNFNKTCLGILFFAIAISSSNSYAQLEIISEPDSPAQIQSSKTCAKCHLDIYSYWKESLHARALDDNIFQSAFMLAMKQKGDEARTICLDCHSPTTSITKDPMLQLPLSSEGITCDYCHRLSHVELNGKNKVTITSGKEKHGPLAAAVPPASHPTVQSDLFRNSELCASCHQWKNTQGIAILDTYQEWLKGPYPAKDVHCQNCHMPLVEGSVSVKSKKGQINSHNLAGGHSIEQVAKAARVKLASVSRTPVGLRAVVEVTNVGSGHMLPTGMPTRALLLEVSLVDANGNVSGRQEHVFKRTILGGDHNELTTDAGIILNGAIISKDNRIPPGGTVTIPFEFAAAADKKYTVKAKLNYRYNPLIMREEEISIDMGTDSKSL